METAEERRDLSRKQSELSPQGALTFRAIPAHFLQWLAASRIMFLEDMKEGKPLRYFSAHLPVMSTWSGEEPFPVNMTVKGIGLVPKAEYLDDYSDYFEGIIADARTKPWQESLLDRIQAMKRLYGDTDNFDPAMAGGLEIFGGRALENLRKTPFASLLYVGMAQTEKGMEYISFQLNGKVEILGRDSPGYRFLLASRRLFEFDRFHLFQPDYPFGYLIRVIEVKDKSPWSRATKRNAV